MAPGRYPGGLLYGHSAGAGEFSRQASNLSSSRRMEQLTNWLLRILEAAGYAVAGAECDRFFRTPDRTSQYWIPF